MSLSPLREHIIAVALSQEGIAYHHQAALKDVACDCIGLAIIVARTLHLVPETWKPPVYSPQAHFHQRVEHLHAGVIAVGGRAVPLEARLPGDMLLFHYGQASGHCGILLPTPPELEEDPEPGERVVLDYVIHASATAGRVVRHRLAGDLLARQRYAFAFPGVED